MGQETAGLDEQIERLRGGDTLSENEVRALCEKVRFCLCVVLCYGDIGVLCCRPQPCR